MAPTMDGRDAYEAKNVTVGIVGDRQGRKKHPGYHARGKLSRCYFLLLALLCTGPCWCWQVHPSDNNPTASQVPAAPGTVATDARDSNVYLSRQSSSRNFVKKLSANFLLDQKDIWTSPLRIDRSSAKWWIFAGVGTFALIAADHPMAQSLPHTGSAVEFGKGASRAGDWYTVFPTAGGLYTAGLLIHNDKLIETGALSLEALASADVVTTVLKAGARRERPNAGDHGGHFEKGGQSFPSGHSTQAWALAAVIADEYGDHKWVPFASYGYATLISTSRVMAQDHFSSDVFVGALIGFFVGHYVVRLQHVHRSHINGIRVSTLTPRVTPLFSRVEKGISLAWEN